MIPEALGQDSPAVGIDLDLFAFTEISGRDFVALGAVDGKAFQYPLNFLDQAAAASFERGPVKMWVTKNLLSTFLGEDCPKGCRHGDPAFCIDLVVEPGGK